MFFPENWFLYTEYFNRMEISGQTNFLAFSAKVLLIKSIKVNDYTLLQKHF